MKIKALIAAACLAAASPLQAISFWQYPQAAAPNSLCISAACFDFSFTGLEFAFFLPDIRIDYMLPVGLPFSLGAWMKTPNPNLKSFGLRLAYHIDLGDEKSDLYIMYCFDFGWLRNDLLVQYNDEPQELRWYDFRIGVRYFFTSFLGFTIESDFYLQGINIGLAIKLF
jgi:hypothetical protein